MAIPTVVALLGRGVTLSTSGTGTATALGSPTAITCNEGIAICDVTAVGNAAGQTVTIEGSSDGGTTYTTVGTFGVSTVASGTIGVRAGINICALTGGVPPLLRYKNVQTGSGSVTATIWVIGLRPNDSVEATTLPGVGNYPKALRFLVQPSSVQHGAHSMTTVTVNTVDFVGTVCAADSTTSVTVALYPLAGVTGVLTGTIPATASSGVASFADLQISAVGQYYLIATATGLTPAISNSFPVTT